MAETEESGLMRSLNRVFNKSSCFVCKVYIGKCLARKLHSIKTVVEDATQEVCTGFKSSGASRDECLQASGVNTSSDATATLSDESPPAEMATTARTRTKSSDLVFDLTHLCRPSQSMLDEVTSAVEGKKRRRQAVASTLRSDSSNGIIDLTSPRVKTQKIIHPELGAVAEIMHGSSKLTRQVYCICIESRSLINEGI